MATLIVWSLTTICMVFWLRHWPKSEVATQVLLSGASANERLDMTASIARALGQTGGQMGGPVVQPSSSYKLIGVVASASGHGSALIEVDGQPPKVYQVGEKIHDEFVLVSLTSRQANLNNSGSNIFLNLAVINQP